MARVAKTFVSTVQIKLQIRKQVQYVNAKGFFSEEGSMKNWKDKRIAALTKLIVDLTIDRTRRGITPELEEDICHRIQLYRREAVGLRFLKVR